MAVTTVEETTVVGTKATRLFSPRSISEFARETPTNLSASLTSAKNHRWRCKWRWRVVTIMHFTQAVLVKNSLMAQPSVFFPRTLTRKQYLIRCLIAFVIVAAAFLFFVGAPADLVRLAGILLQIVVLLAFLYNIFGLSIPRLRNAQLTFLWISFLCLCHLAPWCSSQSVRPHEKNLNLKGLMCPCTPPLAKKNL